MSSMSHRDMVLWAKETILAGIDLYLEDNKEVWTALESLEPDDWAELNRQRNRAAKLFGLPEKNQ